MLAYRNIRMIAGPQPRRVAVRGAGDDSAPAEKGVIWCARAYTACMTMRISACEAGRASNVLDCARITVLRRSDVRRSTSIRLGFPKAHPVSFGCSTSKYVEGVIMSSSQASIALSEWLGRFRWMPSFTANRQCSSAAPPRAAGHCRTVFC